MGLQQVSVPGNEHEMSRTEEFLRDQFGRVVANHGRSATTLCHYPVTPRTDLHFIQHVERVVRDLEMSLRGQNAKVLSPCTL